MKHCPRDGVLLASNELHDYTYFSCQKAKDSAGKAMPWVLLDVLLSLILIR